MCEAHTSDTVDIGKIPLFANIDGAGVPGLFVGGAKTFVIRQKNPAASDGFTARIDRDANYVGGDAFHEVNGLGIHVAARYEANAAETPLGIVLNNFAGGAQNACAHIQANKYGEGHTWALALETIDYTNVAAPQYLAWSNGVTYAKGAYVRHGQINYVSLQGANVNHQPDLSGAWWKAMPLSPAVGSDMHGIEMAFYCNNADPNQQRSIVDVIVGRPFVEGARAGNKPTVTWGIRLAASELNPTNGQFTYGIGFYNEYAACIDTSNATIVGGGSAIRLGSGQSLSLTTTNDRTLDYTGGLFNYRVSLQPVFQVTDNGTVIQQGFLQIGSQRVITSRRPGWSTATGTATRTAYDTATVTLPQLAERVKALIDDLHAAAGHGLIGA